MKFSVQVIHALVGIFIFSNLLSCKPTPVKLKYIRTTHTIKDESRNIINHLDIFTHNFDGSIACEKNILRLTEKPGSDSLNLQKPDTSNYEVHDILKCKMIKDSTYTVVVSFLGQIDSVKIKW